MPISLREAFAAALIFILGAYPLAAFPQEVPAEATPAEAASADASDAAPADDSGETEGDAVEGDTGEGESDGDVEGDDTEGDDTEGDDVAGDEELAETTETPAIPEACAPPQKKTAYELGDKAFEKFVVNPIAAVLFYDLIFWDNNAPRSDAANGLIVSVEQRKRGAKWYEDPETYSAQIKEYRPGENHYVVNRRTEALASDVTFEGDPQRGDTVSLGDSTFVVVGTYESVAMRAIEPTTIRLEKKELQRLQKAGLDIPTCFPLGSMASGGEVIKHLEQGYLIEELRRAPRRNVVRAQRDEDAKVDVGDVVAYGGDPLKKVESIDTMLRLRSTEDEVLVSNETYKVKERPARPGPRYNLFDDEVAEIKAQKKNLGLPLVVVWLILGAIFFTFRMGFINVRAFWHSLRVTAGQFDHPDDPGEVTHFKALASALSATVGLGNIAGVAIAVATGGPGAVFWMIVAGFLGMSSKFVECSLGQMYRQIDENGVVSGGPMRYLSAGLTQLGRPGLGKFLALFFTVMCIGGSLGGGNMFQANQATQIIRAQVNFLPAPVFGIILAVAVGIVIIGGIRRIGNAAGAIVPVMCGVYILAGLWIVITNVHLVPFAFTTIVGEALTFKAGLGGLIGVLITGFQRAAFSNEAGIGSAAIAHSAAGTKEPIREGIVALLGPFIDTIVVCTMTGIVVVITRAYLQDVGDGVLMTQAAFSSVIPWFPWVLTFAVVLFAFSTMISWSYYGERCWSFAFGQGSAMVYRVIFVICVFAGAVFQLGSVLVFSDLMVLGMAFPNIMGIYFLVKKVRAELDDYWGRYKAGEMVPPRAAPAEAEA